MSAWLVKTRRAPSGHSRDATVYDHTTTAMHKLGIPPPTVQCMAVVPRQDFLGSCCRPLQGRTSLSLIETCGVSEAGFLCQKKVGYIPFVP